MEHFANVHRHRTSSNTDQDMTPFLPNSSREVELTAVPSAAQKTGLSNPRAMVVLGIWYFFSFITLVLNKYVLSYQDGDPIMLGGAQMLACFIFGSIHLKLMKYYGQYPKVNVRTPTPSGEQRPWKMVCTVGALRFSTVFWGLVALWFVPVSFAETVKSSAPVFTMILSRVVLHEYTTWLVNFSLVPVMFGLALCSANELSFNAPGFASSLATNFSEWPIELQIYTSASSFIVVVPAVIFFSTNPLSMFEDSTHLLTLAGAAVSFHLQSYVEYILLGYISPVTHSVANTVKRALMIWLSVLVFGNPVTFLSGLGTMIVIGGVLMYNHAREQMAKSAQFDVKLGSVKVTDHDV